MFAEKINLTMSETLLVAVAGIAVVLLELAIIAILIVFLSKIIRALEGKLRPDSDNAASPAATAAFVAAPPIPAAPVAYTPGRTQLIDVDEPTAAVVMALVSKESGIPLERLSFRTIRGITELVDVDERTAATIMAIVSKESGIPLERLSFKSIKKVEE
ncbi:MAG: hypothetical protein IJE72_03330 [Clostridia bacterium]|nr:hypothetical protein [Clostridia bacterium]